MAVLEFGFGTNTDPLSAYFNLVYYFNRIHNIPIHGLYIICLVVCTTYVHVKSERRSSLDFYRPSGRRSPRGRILIGRF